MYVKINRKIKPRHLSLRGVTLGWRLDDIFHQYSNQFVNIDVLSVDAEGFDLKVLKSNNWEIYQPTVILVEQHTLKFNELDSDLTYLFLTSKGYKLVSRCFVTSIYVKE